MFAQLARVESKVSNRTAPAVATVTWNQSTSPTVEIAPEMNVLPVICTELLSASVLVLFGSTSGVAGSSWQVLVQPSPFTVLPSSHCSVPSTNPSPQTGIRLQNASQFGVPSHVSKPSLIPFPHWVS